MENENLELLDVIGSQSLSIAPASILRGKKLILDLPGNKPG